MFANWLAYFRSNHEEESEEQLNQTESKETACGHVKGDQWIWVDVLGDFLEQGNDILIDKELPILQNIGRVGNELNYSSVVKEVASYQENKDLLSNRGKLPLIKSYSDQHVISRRNETRTIKRQRGIVCSSQSLELTSGSKENLLKAIPSIKRVLKDSLKLTKCDLDDAKVYDNQWQSITTKKRKRKPRHFSRSLPTFAVDISQNGALLRIFPTGPRCDGDFHDYVLRSCVPVSDQPIQNRVSPILSTSSLKKGKKKQRHVASKQPRKLTKELDLNVASMPIPKTLEVCDHSCPSSLLIVDNNKVEDDFITDLIPTMDFLPFSSWSPFYDILSFMVSRIVEFSIKQPISAFRDLDTGGCQIIEIMKKGRGMACPKKAIAGQRKRKSSSFQKWPSHFKQSKKWKPYNTEPLLLRQCKFSKVARKSFKKSMPHIIW